MSTSPVDRSRPQHRTEPRATPAASEAAAAEHHAAPEAVATAAEHHAAPEAAAAEHRAATDATAAEHHAASDAAPEVVATAAEHHAAPEAVAAEHRAASDAAAAEHRAASGAPHLALSGASSHLASSAASPRGAARSARLRRWREQALGYAFLAPSLAVFAVFLFYPMIRSVYLSFQLTDPRGRVAAYAGWDNYTGMLQSSAFWNSLLVTLKFTLLTVPAGLALGLLCASLVHSAGRGRSALRFLFSLPLAMSVSTASIIWMILYHPSLGMLNWLLLQLGLGPVQWLTDPGSALGSVSLMTVWMNSGFPFVLLLAAIQGLDGDVLDSARIDGASGWRTFVSVKLPLLSPTLFFLAVVSVMSAFQSFGQIHILTKGGPAGSTDVLVYSIYREAFVNYQFGTGSALAIVLFAIMLLLTLLQFLVLGKKVHYQ
ncbi:carbohydrate ABC transporter permease [Paenibacillus pasadenensis]|uniref:carbohydrate ABC transporter permease n=1 Tax=Paenibacillus TaxID=44249 RepID=UPI00269D8C5E|nr:sugar ABC transporter permease [Paenibacillus pasadenensis]